MEKGQLNKAQHGLCDRKVLNVDHQRERTTCSELQQSKLRRVAFCVDVEIASGPRYTDEVDTDTKKDEKKAKKKLVEKGEGDALKRPLEVKEEKETDGILKSTGEGLPKEPKVEGDSLQKVPTADGKTAPGAPDAQTLPTIDKPTELNEKDTTKKKEKKKRSEEERKARKEKKRRAAEANGTVPVELVRNGSDSSLEATPAASGRGTPRTQASPTTDPARIYRRCCQLRETPILKKITEQLLSPMNCDPSGVVTKLDLSGYWMQLPDLQTLGDYLAVVPVKELAMEGCGLTDEGVRVILSGLLAAKSPNQRSKKRYRSEKTDLKPHLGVVERVCFKNNSNIGREGWRHVCLFINMCRSIKALDMSMNKFPQSASLPPGPETLHKIPSTPTPQVDIAKTFSNALATRLAGPDLELLNLAETGITTEQLGLIIDGVIRSGTCRLGLADNNITAEGVSHIARYIKEGRCEGLDIGGNDLKDHLGVLAAALDEDHPMWALSLSNCDLTPDALFKIFPILSKLKNFKFIDLSHNHELFSTKPSALSLIRKYLPKMGNLKRIHLTDCDITPEQAIALAEILPESPSLAHVNILENKELTSLASAIDEENQEEACALYASLMAAVRVSRTLICIDIDVPSADSSEIVKALAKQVVAYCLRNMERGPVAEIAQAAAALSEPHGGEKEIAVPEVLLHLVGHGDGSSEHTSDNDDPAPDQDYVIGGSGVVKALGICLRNSGHDSRRPSTDRTWSDSGTTTPKVAESGKAKDMSKNLLGSARKIRARLQPAIIRESQIPTDRAAHRKLSTFSARKSLANICRTSSLS